jgi:hypothetical protein
LYQAKSGNDHIKLPAIEIAGQMTAKHNEFYLRWRSRQKRAVAQPAYLNKRVLVTYDGKRSWALASGENREEHAQRLQSTGSTDLASALKQSIKATKPRNTTP